MHTFYYFILRLSYHLTTAMSIANRIDRTNKEILDWLHQMKGKKDYYSEAERFFGDIDCGHNAFHHWKNHLVNNAYIKKRSDRAYYERKWWKIGETIQTHSSRTFESI